jgi:hypothetical protein
MNPYSLVEEWAKLNSLLEKAWEPYRAQVARRDEIEKEIPWLKGHGASPYPSKTSSAVPPPISSSPSPAGGLVSPPRPETKFEKAEVPGKRNRTETGLKGKVDKLKASGGSGKSPSEIPISGDSTQNFASEKH